VQEHGSATRWGARDAVMVGTRLLAVVYLVVTPIELLVLDGGSRLVAAAVAAVSSLFFAATARLALRVREETVDALLVLVCVVPLVNAFVHVLLTGRIEQSVVVILVAVGIGAVATSRRSGRSLLLMTCLSWLVVVLLRSPAPTHQIPFYAFLLALACVLSLAILEIRLVAYRRLTRAINRSSLGLHRFRSVFDHSPVGIGLADEDGLFVEANAALCELLARSAADVLGHSSAEFTHPDDRDPDEEAGRLLGRTPGGVDRVEMRYVRPDGELRWVWVSTAAVEGPLGEAWTVSHAQDVTERRLAEDQLRLSRESMVAAVDIAQATQSGQDPRPVVLHHLRRLADASFVSLTEPLGADRMVVTAVDGELDLVGLSMDLDEASVTNHVWRTGEAVFASQVTEHPLVTPQLLRESGAASLMWQPVGVSEDLLAVLSIAWDDPMPGVDTAGRAAVEAVAAEAGAALVGERMRKDLERSTVTDTLTGLLNRRGWDTEVTRLQQHADRTGTPFTLALVDLDHFKQFNDTRGHLAGDEALRSFAERCRSALRAVDVMARWGGEEFTVALQGTSGGSARVAIERLRACAPEGLTCSVGFVEMTLGDSVPAGLLLADEALYEAKRTGRDRAVRADRSDRADRGVATPTV
jgi:diguanylate cyclase (GGDEF)-like protein/PAS domain S-box-containing protein